MLHNMCECVCVCYQQILLLLLFGGDSGGACCKAIPGASRDNLMPSETVRAVSQLVERINDDRAEQQLYGDNYISQTFFLCFFSILPSSYFLILPPSYYNLVARQVRRLFRMRG